MTGVGRHTTTPAGGDEFDAFAALTAELGLLYGGDYNPEQWDEATWVEDVALMRAAGVTLVTVGVFSWARYEPEPGARDMAWMDRVLDLLHEGGIAVDLATPTASPPPWLGHRHPETLPQTADGTRLLYGSRNQFSPSSAAYRSAALAITKDVVARYAPHPAVRMWHVGNELGQVSYDDESAAAFRTWLRSRYGDLATLNEAWGTWVWSQRYASWDEVAPPRVAPYHRNPSLELDFRRFTSDALREVYREQAAVIRATDTRRRPVTTNYMGFFPLVDYASWRDDVDVVADDSYPDAADPRRASTTALTQDLMRSLGGGRPWMLMEQATSAVTFRAHNLTKTPARSRLESLQAVARGSDGICFFQWRAARTGPERFHSAMLPHAGPDTDVHRGVRRLGADLAALAGVAGTRLRTDVAVLFDWQSWWATGQDGLPTNRMDALATLRDYYEPLWRAGIAVDVVEPGADLTPYRLVLAPSLYVLEPEPAAALAAWVADGGHLLLGPLTAVADAQAHVRPGRFPVLLADVVGVSGEEWVPLPEDGVGVAWDGQTFVARTFAEHLRLDGAQAVATFTDGALAGAPAVTRNEHGAGRAWYVGAVLPPDRLAALVERVLREAGVHGLVPDLPRDVEVTRRGDVLFVLNHSGEARQLPVGNLLDALAPPRSAGPPGSAAPPVQAAIDLLTGALLTRTGAADALHLPPDDVVVLTERHP